MESVFFFWNRNVHLWDRKKIVPVLGSAFLNVSPMGSRFLALVKCYAYGITSSGPALNSGFPDLSTAMMRNSCVSCGAMTIALPRSSMQARIEFETSGRAARAAVYLIYGSPTSVAIHRVMSEGRRPTTTLPSRRRPGQRECGRSPNLLRTFSRALPSVLCSVHPHIPAQHFRRQHFVPLRSNSASVFSTTRLRRVRW